MKPQDFVHAHVFLFLVGYTCVYRLRYEFYFISIRPYRFKCQNNKAAHTCKRYIFVENRPENTKKNQK